MVEVIREAQMKETEAGLIPEGEGWFVVNARDVSWIQSDERGQDTDFEGEQEWSQVGLRIQVLSPGQRGLYHGERGQEDFLVVAGASVLEETQKPADAHAHLGPEERVAYRDGWLP